MSLDNKVHEAVSELTDVLDQTEKTKANADSLRKLSQRLARVTDEPDGFTEAVREVLGADRVATYREVVGKAGELAEAIEKVTTPATPAVAHLAENLRGLVGWLDADDRAEVDGVLKRWDSLKPRRERTGATSKPDLGFTVRVKCEKCGETIASSQKQNVNSLRDAVRQHHGSKHGVKFGRGDELFDGVTEAIKAVMENGSGQSQGGGYVVLKNGKLSVA